MKELVSQYATMCGIGQIKDSSVGVPGFEPGTSILSG